MDGIRRLELDAVALKAMAHPMRVRILRHLDLHGRASVTSLADELGETTGATSYHLRQLARHGFVTDAEPEGDDASPSSVGRRQRWWRMAVDEIHMTGFAFLRDENTREAAGFVLREILADRTRRLAHWFASESEWPEEWQKAASDSDGHLRLDPTQTRALADELSAVIRKYRGLRPGEGARAVDVQYAVFPAETGHRP